MAGFVKRNWGGNASNQSQAQSQQQTTNTTNNNGKLGLNIKFGKYNDKGNLIFKVTSFHFNDVKLLNSKYGELFFVKMQETKNSQYPLIYFIVKPENLEEFKKQLPNIAQDLKATGHYNDRGVDEFEDKILSIIEKTPTPDEIAANDKVVITNWKDLFKQLRDPETRKRFLAFQTTYTCMNTYSDAALSPGNVIEVMLADPQASFVTDASTWKNKYNRTVNPGSPFIIVTKPEQTLPPLKLLEADPVVRQNGGWSALCKKCGGPWYGEAWAAQKRVKKQHNLFTNYYRAKVYDVRFTTPIDPNNDTFVKMANLINNLTGEVNEAAKELLRIEARKNGQEEPDFNSKHEGIETPEELVKFKDFILAKCANKKIKIAEVGSTQDIIANAVYAYAYEAAKDFNTLGDKGKTYFASAVLYAVAYSFNIESYKVADAINVLERLSDEEQEKVYQSTYECFKSLSAFSLHEDIGSISFEQYLNIFKNINPKKTIKNSFDDLNNRMDNLYKS